MREIDDFELAKQQSQATMPECLEPYWENIASGILPDDDIYQLLVDAYPDVMQRAEILLSWYEAGSVSAWWYGVPTLQDRAVSQLIGRLSMETLSQSVLKNDTVLISGVARYFLMNKPDSRLVPQAEQRLFKFCFEDKSDDEKYPISSKFKSKALFKVFRQVDLQVHDLAIAQVGQEFALDLFHQINEREINRNILISPYSLIYVLILLYCGAAGETKTRLESLLNLSSLDDMVLNLQIALMLLSLGQNDEITLKISSSMWFDKYLTINPQFAERLQTYFQTHTTNLDFASLDSIEIINQWAAEATNGRIPKILDDLESLNRLFIANAIYFYAGWESVFQLFGPLPFHFQNGTVQDRAFMKRDGIFHYFRNDQYEAITLPYGRGTAQMEIYMPNESIGLRTDLLPSWIEEFNQLKDENNPFYSRMAGYDDDSFYISPYGIIEMPLFQFEYEIEVSAVMMQLGLVDVFNPKQANLSEMLVDDIPLWVNEILHKTFIKVDPLGTEAATVTGAKIAAGTGIPPEPTFHMRVDCPFMFVIRHLKVDQILFAGMVVDPI